MVLPFVVTLVIESTMADKQCSACNWCFPLCCCTGDQLHIPLAILSVLLVLSSFGSVSDLVNNSSEWGYYGTGAEIVAWLLSILNIIAPFTYIISLFECIKLPIRRILVIIFFIYLVIDAILIGIFAIIFFVFAANFNTADCIAEYDDGYDSTTNHGDYSGWCNFIHSFEYFMVVIIVVICLIHVNWAGATWYYYSNNMKELESDNYNRLVANTGGASINNAPTGGATTGGVTMAGETNAYAAPGTV